ncbi:hypothetical protein [Marinilabilia salmonicolor]|uniref:hypothetical protein n=1 Tax=Marinilabilia salmonicolor TaxID=989 RepID=UPI000299E242|nr:hypothetical protein [Marinilabilia salmonicolor]
MTLKSELDEFAGLFKQHLRGAVKATLRWVDAESVDWENKTMTATDEDDLPYYDVLLGVGMMAVKPVKGTECLIAILEGNEATAFLLYANDAELIEFNQGLNGGFANTPELKTQLEKLTARVDGIIDAINNGVPGSSDGGAALLTTIKTGLSSITDKEDFSEIEDSKITH